jgi:hypothetical protein
LRARPGAIESDPISREQQNRNMAEFLGSLAQEMNVPADWQFKLVMFEEVGRIHLS